MMQGQTDNQLFICIDDIHFYCKSHFNINVDVNAVNLLIKINVLAKYSCNGKDLILINDLKDLFNAIIKDSTARCW